MCVIVVVCFGFFFEESTFGVCTCVPLVPLVAFRNLPHVVFECDCGRLISPGNLRTFIASLAGCTTTFISATHHEDRRSGQLAQIYSLTKRFDSAGQPVDAPQGLKASSLKSY